MDVDEAVDLLFDVSYYKAAKQVTKRSKELTSLPEISEHNPGALFRKSLSNNIDFT